MHHVIDIMTPMVYTIHRDKFVSEVEGVFEKRKISGAPLINDQGSIVGIVSKSDINHFIFTGGDVDYAKVWEIASPQVITISVTATVQQAALKMLDNEVHRLIVIDKNKMVGLLSSFDFVKLVAEGGVEIIVRPAL